MTISDIAKRFGFSESGFTQFLNQQDTIPITNRLFAPSIADEDIPKAINEYKAFLYKAIEEKTLKIAEPVPKPLAGSLQAKSGGKGCVRPENAKYTLVRT